MKTHLFLLIVSACLLVAAGCGSEESPESVFAAADGGGNANTGGSPDAGNTVKGAGSPCASSKDCPTYQGSFMFCLTKTEDTSSSSTWNPVEITWPQGYCTQACDKASPNCPPNSKCVEAHCLQGCGGDADCRSGYACHGGVCLPNVASCKKSCAGCCDTEGNCQPGTADNQCGSYHYDCVSCPAQTKCVDGGPMMGQGCYCKNDCTDGCCDPVTGACKSGSSDSACGDMNMLCEDCTKTGEACDWSIRICK